MNTKKRVGITRFPGTNCDYDVYSMAKELGHDPVWLWHEEEFPIENIDCVIVPGGFSYGDYLRCGALAAKSPLMKSVKKFAEAGKPVLGICNGFQILCEAGLLPGVLTRNQSLRFIDDWCELEVQNSNPFFATQMKTMKLPIAHGEGNYFIDDKGYEELKTHGQIWMTYQKNPNGSRANIAGVMNKKKNVAALMPHPERALAQWMGGQDGANFL